MGEGAVLPEANSAFVCLFKDFFATADFSTGQCLFAPADFSTRRRFFFNRAVSLGGDRQEQSSGSIFWCCSALSPHGDWDFFTGRRLFYNII